VQGSGSRPESARGDCGGSAQNRSGCLVELQNQDRRLGGRRRDPGKPISFEAEDTHRDCKACVETKRGAVIGHPSNAAMTRIHKVPLGGMYPNIM
jgi:hypothetical protein